MRPAIPQARPIYHVIFLGADGAFIRFFLRMRFLVLRATVCQQQITAIVSPRSFKKIMAGVIVRKFSVHFFKRTLIDLQATGFIQSFNP
jgi:hypothetical protein